MGKSERYVAQVIRAAFLAPDFVNGADLRERQRPRCSTSMTSFGLQLATLKNCSGSVSKSSFWDSIKSESGTRASGVQQ